MKTTFLKQILERLQSESPQFFIVLRWVFGVLAVIAGIVKWVIAKELWTPDNVKLIDAVQEICGYIITSASTMWFSSLLPIKETISPTLTVTTTQKND